MTTDRLFIRSAGVTLELRPLGSNILCCILFPPLVTVDDTEKV